MGWVQDYYHFPRHVRCLELPRDKMLTEALRMFDKHPDAIEQVLRAIIIEHRPELVDCSLVAMSMNYQRACWECHVEHPSFENVPDGCEIKREPLVRTA